MRPKTIVYFERIIFGALLLGALTGYLDWDRLTTQTPALPVSALVIGVIFGLVLAGTLALLVSRRRSKIAMWVLVAISTLGLAGASDGLTTGRLPGWVIIETVLQNIAYIVALGLLFTPSARRWMNEKNEEAA